MCSCVTPPKIERILTAQMRLFFIFALLFTIATVLLRTPQWLSAAGTFSAASIIVYWGDFNLLNLLSGFRNRSLRAALFVFTLACFPLAALTSEQGSIIMMVFAILYAAIYGILGFVVFHTLLQTMDSCKRISIIHSELSRSSLNEI